MIKKFTFNSNSFKLEGILSSPEVTTQTGVLFLHGGGHADAARYRDVQAFLSDQGITSLAFSFRGCGKSEGSMSNSTLLDRLLDSESALTMLKQMTGLSDTQIFIWGSSMGGHVGCRLVDRHPMIRGLLLQSAAAYGADVENISFGSEFTRLIQMDKSWQGSRAFANLGNYSGPTLILYGQDDLVVPDGVKFEYKSSAKHVDYQVIAGYGHPMLKPSNDAEKQAWATMVNLALNFILDGN